MKVQARSRLLYAMSLPRAEAKRRITGVAFQIADHIVKLLLIPHSINRNHWLNELDAWYRLCAKAGNNLKGNRKLSTQDYWELLFREELSSDFDISQRKNAVQRMEDPAYRDLSLSELRKSILSVYKILCSSLYRNVDWNKVENQLLSLL